MVDSRNVCAAAKRVVVKVGSRVLVGNGPGTIDRGVFAPLVQEIASHASDRKLVVVSSGAIALGRGKLAKSKKDASLARLQALAALGQSALMQLYEHEFAFHNHLVGQVLLTQADIDDRRRFINARHTLKMLTEEMRAIPIVNENDTVANDEIRLGDNDRLAALVAILFEADLLVILSDVDGLYSSNPDTDPNAALLPRVKADDPALDQLVWKSPTGPGRGGMATKIEAARMAAGAGVPTVVAAGRKNGNLSRVLSGDAVGTLFMPAENGLSARRLWLLHGVNSAGTITVDDGAARALKARGTSLLPSGIVGVDGKFGEGAAIEIASNGVVIARGLSSYSSADIARIAGKHSADIASILGFKNFNSVVHCDDMVLVD